MLSKSHKGKIPKEPTIKKLGSSCEEIQVETQELFCEHIESSRKIKLDPTPPPPRPPRPRHTGHFFQMPNKNLESQGKVLEVSMSALKEERLTAIQSFGMLSGLQTNGGCRLPGDRQHRARTTPDADICSYLSRCADGETMSPGLMGS